MDETKKPVNDHAGAESGLNVGLERCWPWRHKYTAWIDTHTVTKSRTSDNTAVAYGVLQERRCHLCGKLQLRTAWAL